MKKPKKKVFRLRVSDFECDLLQERAKAAGMTATAYVRFMVFPKVPKKTVATNEKKTVATKGLKPILSPEVIAHLNKVASIKVEIEENVATKEPLIVDMKVKKKKASKTSAIDFAKSPPSYRRFAEPGALLKK